MLAMLTLLAKEVLAQAGQSIVALSKLLVGTSVPGFAAMILAHERSNLYGELLSSIKATMFFGTPHRGSDAAYWATYAAKIFKILQAGRGTNTSFVSALQKNSPEFANISQQWIERALQLIIRTFYKTERLLGELIVDKDSARLGLPNEIPVGVAGADHRNICKFDDFNGQKYKPIWNATEELALFVLEEVKPYTASDEETRCYCAWRLTDPSEDKSRILSAKDPLLQDSYSWVLEDSAFTHWWNDDDCRILWIHGDPGKGKTMMAIALIGEISRRQKSKTASVDALDECNAQSTALFLRLLTGEIPGSKKKVKWLVTSRNERDITESFRGARQIHDTSLELNSAHVRRVVKSFIVFKVRDLTKRKDYDNVLETYIQNCLDDNADGTFLWVSLVCCMYAVSGRTTALYQRMIEQIQEDEDEERLVQVLRTMTLACRPLGLSELGLIANLPEHISSNRKYLLDLIKFCGSFLVLQDETIDFVHKSAKDYFTEGSIIFPRAQAIVHNEL
ncbi:hypothetical protein BP6252_14102 [Coleophoma cylindrospora]|uniref:Nephrocystin 3-like N-terminal domain-containing protein n=1 Tax=Coleophoma cylindrospora TaxID=1849047 RepID=A0A3D8Q3Y8_9HELO|nr:hypothetical protein BP6252_14102 [Coleophoma cylindrospora]